jgi:hypothetical protein
MDGGSGSNKNVVILIILSLLASLAFQLATLLGGLDELERVLEDQVLLLSLAVTLLALFKETRL